MPKSIKQEALEHYDRMIKWVKTQSNEDMPNHSAMLRAIHENWFGNDCPYCGKYYMPKDKKCKCRLNPEKKYRLPSDCCDGLWVKMSICTYTWADWLKYARKVRAYINKHG